MAQRFKAEEKVLIRETWFRTESDTRTAKETGHDRGAIGRLRKREHWEELRDMFIEKHLPRRLDKILGENDQVIRFAKAMMIQDLQERQESGTGLEFRAKDFVELAKLEIVGAGGHTERVKIDIGIALEALITKITAVLEKWIPDAKSRNRCARELSRIAAESYSERDSQPNEN